MRQAGDGGEEGSLSSVAEVESLTHTIDALQAHVDKIDLDARESRDELPAKEKVIAKNQARMGFVMPGVVGGGALTRGPRV